MKRPPFFLPKNTVHAIPGERTTSKSVSQRRKVAPVLPGIVAGERVLIAQIPKVESETSLKKRIRIALAASGALAWNNPVGAAKMPSGHWVEYGLCEGSADIIGLVKVTGGIGRFFAVEVKKPKTGVVREAQERWAAVVRRWGGYVVFARCVDDAMVGLRECREGVLQ